MSAARLIGRESVLAVAGAVLRDAAAGHGQLLLISGEAGIGKTAVMAELVGQAERHGAVALRGFCWDGAGVPPYWPWTQVIRGTGLSAGELGAASRLLEDAPQPNQPMNAAAAADAQFRLFEAVSKCLHALAGDRMLLVVIDDLHWADEPSLRLLEFLTRMSADRAVLLLGAFRDLEAPPELHRLAGTSSVLPLTGLSQTEVAQMVEVMPGPPPSADATSQLWQRSGGNPFFVRELTRLLVTQGSSVSGSGRPGPVPASVAETLRRRLARLSTDCVRVLDQAAVIGRDIDIGLLAHIGVDETQLGPRLEEALHAGVLVGTPPDLRFGHDLYRETILAGLTATARAAANLAVGTALSRTATTSPARIAAHLMAGGSTARRAAVEYSILAAQLATGRLGHEDACSHYQRALSVVEQFDVVGEPARMQLLLELGAAHERTGASDLALQRYRQVVHIGRESGDAVTLARGALGMHALGNRSGMANTELVELLREAAEWLEADNESLAVRSEVHAALARSLRHGAARAVDPDTVPAAQRAVELAIASADARTVASARLALQDAMWSPGTASARLPQIDSMLAAAKASGDRDLVAEAHLLRAGALIELGDPAGRSELATYVDLSAELGHARGRWGALSRRATLAELSGHAAEAARLADEAFELGTAIGVPDAMGCYSTLRWSLVALGVPEPQMGSLDVPDPSWPMLPLLLAWAPAVRGDLAAATDALGDFSVLNIPVEHDLEALAVAAVVFAVAGSPAQRSWTYRQLAPYAGTHVLVGGCASYHAAVDHHLGALAVSLADTAAARQHFGAALRMHDRLGAAGWARLSAAALSTLEAAEVPPPNQFRRIGDQWLLSFGGRQAHLRDSKGMRDLAALLAARGHEVSVLTLLGQPTTVTGADPMLDARAKAEFRTRLADLAAEVDQAEDWHDSERADRLRDERDQLLSALATATGLGGRPRRLGDEAERARKAVSFRVRDALGKIRRVHPELAEHLRASLQMGASCSYRPAEPTTWSTIAAAEHR